MFWRGDESGWTSVGKFRGVGVNLGWIKSFRG